LVLSGKFFSNISVKILIALVFPPGYRSGEVFVIHRT